LYALSIMVNTIQKVLSSQINLDYSGKTVGIK